MSGFPLPPIVVELVAQVVGAALAAFLRTTIGMSMLGLAVAGAAFWHAASVATWRGVLAAVATLGICVVIGLVLAAKRAAWLGVRELARRHRVGGRVIDAVFDRIATVHGTAALARIPLASAEQWLRAAIAELGTTGGFLRRRITARLLTSVEHLTLARFRDADAGGIDLALVRTELASRADDLIDAHVSGIGRKLTIGLVGGALVASCVASFAIARL